MRYVAIAFVLAGLWQIAKWWSRFVDYAVPRVLALLQRERQP